MNKFLCLSAISPLPFLIKRELKCEARGIGTVPFNVISFSFGCDASPIHTKRLLPSFLPEKPKFCENPKIYAQFSRYSPIYVHCPFTLRSRWWEIAPGRKVTGFSMYTNSCIIFESTRSDPNLYVIRSRYGSVLLNTVNINS
jgi:hypothetical protein